MPNPDQDDLARFMAAIAHRESSSNYSAVGANTGSRYGVALGKYQIMSKIMPGWAKAAGFGNVSTQEFLNSPSMQDAVAARQFSYYYRRYGRWDLVAAAWFGGEGTANRMQRSGLSSTSGINDTFINVPEYVRRVMSSYQAGEGRGPGGIPASRFTGGSSSPSERTAWSEGMSIREIIQAEFPSMVWAINHPELGPILREAAREEWTPLRMEGAIQGTSWWRRRNEQERELEILKRTDPESYSSRVDDAAQQALTLAQDLGVPMNRSAAMTIGRELLTNNYNERELTARILGRITISDAGWYRRSISGAWGGAVAEAGTQIRDVADQYLVRLGQGARGKWVRDIALGKRTVGGFEEYARRLAKSQMPWVDQFLEQGLTPMQGLDPYRQEFARMLEISPTDVDFHDRKVQNTIQVTENGERRLATTAELSAQIRRNFNRQWQTTRNAQRAATELTGELAGMFGRR